MTETIIITALIIADWCILKNSFILKKKFVLRYNIHNSDKYWQIDFLMRRNYHLLCIKFTDKCLILRNLNPQAMESDVNLPKSMLEDQIAQALRHNARQEREYREQQEGKRQKRSRKKPVKVFIQMKFGKEKQKKNGVLRFLF